MKKFCLYVVTPFLSFIGGFFAYNLTLKIVWDQTISSGDMDFVLLWGGIAFFLLAVPIYVGIIRLIDKRFNRLKGVLYPIGCMLVFFLPTIFISLSFGSVNPFTPEAMLFHAFFLVSGLLFGLLSWLFNRTSGV